MAAVEEDFGSLDDNVLLQACEDYEQSQDEGGEDRPEDRPSDGGIVASKDDKATSTSGPKMSVAEYIYEENNKIYTTTAQSMRSKYVNASDLQMQEWCEQQMIYIINAKMGILPQMIPEEGAVVQVKEVQLTTPAMKAGTEVHKKKDLEVNSYVPIDVNTQGDSFALKLLNTIQNVKQLVMGARCVREVTVFSTPFDYGFMIMGIVDELRINDHEELEIVEVKTRSNRHTQPGKAQVRKNNLQVMVYKQIIDDLVTGVVDGNLMLEKMRLDPKHVLDEKILEQARMLDIPGTTLGDMMAAMLDQFRFLPKVGSVVIEYYPSDKDKAYKELLSSRRVQFDEAWLKKRLETHFGFWRGERDQEVSGVDIEELWKCKMCQFVEACHWRKKKNDECLKKKNAKR